MNKKLLIAAMLSGFPLIASAMTQEQANELIAQKNQDISTNYDSSLNSSSASVSNPQGNKNIRSELSALQAEIPALRNKNENYLIKQETAGQISKQEAQPYATWTNQQAHSVPQGNQAIHQAMPVQDQVQQSVNTQFPIPNAKTTLGKLRADASAISRMAQTWQTLTNSAYNYHNLIAYADGTWAGEGPQVSVEYGGVVQCHNPRWDTITQNFVLPGLNLAGDGEVENYAIQAISTHFQAELADYTEALMSAQQHPRLLHRLEKQKGDMLASEKSLSELLSTISNQVQAAIGPQTTLRQLPVHYKVGVGSVASVPEPAQSGYVPGRNDGAPIGWSVYPQLAYQVAEKETVKGKSVTKWVTYYHQLPNMNVCPTGSGGVSVSSMGIMQTAEQAIKDEPSLQGPLSALMNTPSSYQAQPYVSVSMDNLRPFSVSSQFIQVLGWDLWKIGGYMAPVTSSLETFNQQVQQTMQEINAG